jgi:hypothetical protein
MDQAVTLGTRLGSDGLIARDLSHSGLCMRHAPHQGDIGSMSAQAHIGTACAQALNEVGALRQCIGVVQRAGFHEVNPPQT